MRKKLFILPLAFFGITATTLATGYAISAVIAENETTLVGTQINDRYDLNSIIEIKPTYRLSNGGSEFEIIDSILKYPSGNRIKSNSFTLDQNGYYNLTLSHGASITYNKSFYVNSGYISTTNSNTEITYDDLNAQFSSKGYHKGLSIKAMENDFITFKKPINVYENDLTKLIYFNLVQMEQKVKNVDIRLTDCYDPDIYLDILYKRGTKETLTYVSFSAMGQKDAGLDKEQNGLVKIGDDNYTISPYGGTIMDSNSPVSGNYNNFMFYLDTSDRSHIKLICETDTVYKKCIVSELNNSEIYSYNFPGFTNGNVYLSIAANNFEGVDSAKLEIAEACGLSGESLHSLIGAAYNDDNAPIFLSTLGDNVHQIKSGVEFTVPSVQVVDDTGVRGTYDYAVWYNYDSNAKYMVSVNNGKFLPNNLGYYTIVYSATDYFNNVGKYRVDLIATTSGSSGIDFKFNGLGEIEAGHKYYLNQYEASSLAGPIEIKIEVTNPRGVVEVLDNPSLPYSVRYVGNYTVKYLYHDAFYEGEYVTSFTSKSAGKPIFNDKEILSLPYYVKNASYSIENVQAYVCSENEPVLSNVEAFVSFDGGEFVTCNRQNVKITGNSTVQFKYVADGNESTAIYSEVNKIVDTNFGTSNLNLGNYFPSDAFADKYSDEYGLNLKATSAGNGTIDFANKLYLSAFSMKFKVSELSLLNQFDVVLSDYYNRNNKIKISLASYNGSSNFISINDEPISYIDTDWKGCDIEIQYISEKIINVTLSRTNENNRLVTYSYNLVNNVTFTNQYLLLSFDAQNIGKGDVVNIATIMKQRFDVYTKADTNSGVCSIDQIDTIATLGSTVTIPVLYYVDVLSPASELNATLSVNQISPDARTMTSKDGTTLYNVNNFYDGFEVVLDKYGEYQIIYNYSDGVGNKIKTTDAGRVRPVISVVDEVPPTISLSAQSQKAKVGEKITPLKVLVNDNYCAEDELEVYYFVFDDQGGLVASIKQGETFVIKKSGTYIVYVNCVDTNGNSAYLKYNLYVS